MCALIDKKKVTVIVPFYRVEITPREAIALEQCFRILSGHDIIAIKPHWLALPAAVLKYPFKDVVSFDDAFFKSVKSYSTLMLSEKFYKAFLDYEFMLIHQLDAFVFEDRLDYWCSQPYDYIGAPWLRNGHDPGVVKSVWLQLSYFFHTRFSLHKKGEPTKYQYENKVGNGGFSLRRVAVFHRLCLQRDAEMERYINLDGHHFNEDRFWSVEVNRKKNRIKIPGYKKGVGFSFELVPEKALRLNNGQLPFGCHAWNKYDNFWRPIFKSIGYEI